MAVESVPLEVFTTYQTLVNKRLAAMEKELKTSHAAQKALADRIAILETDRTTLRNELKREVQVMKNSDRKFDNMLAGIVKVIEKELAEINKKIQSLVQDVVLLYILRRENSANDRPYITIDAFQKVFSQREIAIGVHKVVHQMQAIRERWRISGFHPNNKPTPKAFKEALEMAGSP